MIKISLVMIKRGTKVKLVVLCEGKGNRELTAAHTGHTNTREQHKPMRKGGNITITCTKDKCHVHTESKENKKRTGKDGPRLDNHTEDDDTVLDFPTELWRLTATSVGCAWR